MKLLVSFLVLCAAAFGQSPGGPKVVTYNRADVEHCAVQMFEGTPQLVTTYEGTSVAVGLPTDLGNGEFSVLVRVSQTGAGKARVKPKDFSAFLSDGAHTRLEYFDKAAEPRIRTRAPAGSVAGSTADPNSGKAMAGTQPTPGSLNDNSWAGQSRLNSGRDPNAGARSEEQMRESKTRQPQGEAVQSGFLREGSIKQGASVAGLVYLKAPRGSQTDSGQSGGLGEIDIPINGVIYRF